MVQNNDRIRIAILDHNPDLGGAEVAILTLLKKMDRSRFEATVILPSRGAFSEALQRIGVPVSIIHLPMGLIRLKRGRGFRSLLLLFVFIFYLHFFLLRLCIYLKRNHFQLILTNTIKAHLYGSISARLCSIPLVWRFHDILSAPDFSPLLVRFIALFGKLFPRKILAVSRATQDSLVKNGVEKRRTEVIFNAIDEDLFEIRENFKGIREEYHLDDTVKLVGCVGRILPQKGQMVLLRAIPGVLERYRDTFFLIVGEAFLGEEAYKNELLEFIDKNGIKDSIRFTGFRKDIRRLISSLDVMVFPSITPEAFGLSTLEAMSLAKPVIASDVGGIREMIEDGETGLLVEPNRPEQITEAILCLFNCSEVSDRIGQKAKEVAQEKFPLKNYVLQMEQACYDSAASP